MGIRKWTSKCLVLRPDRAPSTINPEKSIKVAVMLRPLIQTIKETSHLGRNMMERGKSWTTTAAGWGAGLGLLGLYLTDWQAVTGYIPFIKDKYKHGKPR